MLLKLGLKTYQSFLLSLFPNEQQSQAAHTSNFSKVSKKSTKVIALFLLLLLLLVFVTNILLSDEFNNQNIGAPPMFDKISNEPAWISNKATKCDIYCHTVVKSRHVGMLG